MIHIIASIAACALIVMSVYLAFMKLADMASDLILSPIFPEHEKPFEWWPSITCLGMAMGIIYALVSELI